MPLGKVRKIFLGIIVLFIAVSLTVGVYVVRTQRTENRSKAGGLTMPPAFSGYELPIAEFGTIEKINGIGYKPQKALAKKPSAVLGETAVACQKTDSGSPLCPALSPPAPDFCKGGIITPGQTDACGCIGPPNCAYPFEGPMPENCSYQGTGDVLSLVCQTPIPTGTSVPTPTCNPNNPIDYPAPPPNCSYVGGTPCTHGTLVCATPTASQCQNQPDGTQCYEGIEAIRAGICQGGQCVFDLKPTPPPLPTRYIFKTFDGRTYIIKEPEIPCAPGATCPQRTSSEAFDYYLGKPVMVEGILKRSRCTYAPDVTDYRCEALQNLQDANPSIGQVAFNWWPLPPDGILESRIIHSARQMNKEELLDPVGGVLSIPTASYANENVYVINDFRKCPWPVCGPKYIKSSTTDLSRFLNQTIQASGRHYALGGDIFIDAVSVSTTGPSVTPQPTCIPFPKECLNPPPRDPNAELGFCDAVQQDMQFAQMGGRTSQYCPPPCTPLDEGILSCMKGGKSLDDCTATMGAPILPWCKPTPPIPQPECSVKPEGASCCASNCPAGGICIQSCAEGTCNNGQCLPIKPELICQGKPDGTYCSPQGYCQSQKCVPVPPRCYFQQVQCFKAPCNPILVCPTPTPTCKTGVNSFSVDTTCGNGGSRFASYTCYDGTTGRLGDNGSCRSANEWLQAATNSCSGHTSCPPVSHCQNQPDGSFCSGGGGCGGCETDQNGLTVCPACTQFAGYCQKGICIQGPTPTPYQDMCNNQPEGSSCTISDDCPVCDPKSGPCSLRPCRLIQGVCNNRNCIPGPTPTPTSQCGNQPNGSQCWISGNCPPPPPCTGPGPCAVPACLTSPGICQNGTCIPGKPTNSCNGAPNGVSCTLSVCNHPILFGGFGDFLPKQCKELPGICQNNSCIEPPKPTLASCKQGDINRDGTVDTQDLGFLLVNFLKHVPQLSVPTVDINGDGVVDLSDYSLFAKDFGSSTGPCI